MRKLRLTLTLIISCVCMSACGLSGNASSEESDGTDTAKTDQIEETGTGGEDADTAGTENDRDKETRDVMPEFSVTDLDGNTVTQEIFSQADLTVVNFWATYCSPCIDEMPELAKWDASLPENVQIIGIVTDVATEDSEEAVLARQIVEKTGVQYENLTVANEFDDLLSELIGVPTTYFVDREGNIVGDPIVGADVDGYKEFVEEYL